MEGDVMFFIGWKYVAVWNADVILCNDCYNIIHLFDGFEDISMYFRWINNEILFFWTDVKGEFRGESVIDYRCSGRVLDAAVVNCILFIFVFNFMIGVVIDTIISRVC